MTPDSSGKRYIEVDLSNNERARLTLVPDSWGGQGGIRIQIRDATGHLRRGPEVPLAQVDEVVAGMLELVRAAGHVTGGSG
jgi:hypothetical protein